MCIIIHSSCNYLTMWGVLLPWTISRQKSLTSIYICLCKSFIIPPAKPSCQVHDAYNGNTVRHLCNLFLYKPPMIQFFRLLWLEFNMQLQLLGVIRVQCWKPWRWACCYPIRDGYVDEEKRYMAVVQKIMETWSSLWTTVIEWHKTVMQALTQDSSLESPWQQS